MKPLLAIILSVNLLIGVLPAVHAQTPTLSAEEVLKNTVIPQVTYRQANLHDVLIVLQADARKYGGTEAQSIRLITDRKYTNDEVDSVTLEGIRISALEVFRHVVATTKLNYETNGPVILLFKGDKPHPIPRSDRHYKDAAIVGRWKSDHGSGNVFHFFEDGTFSIERASGYKDGWREHWRPVAGTAVRWEQGPMRGYRLLTPDEESKPDSKGTVTAYEFYNPINPTKQERLVFVDRDHLVIDHGDYMSTYVRVDETTGRSQEE